MTTSSPPLSGGGLRADLGGRIALVTGASRGIGARLARTLAGAGAAVALTGRDETCLAELEAEIVAGGGNAQAFPHDLLAFDCTGELFDRVEKGLGPVDLLVNNAATSITGRAVETDRADVDHIFDTNVKASYLLCLELARRRIAAKQPASVINIASINGEQPRAGLALYCMSKAAVIMMTRVLAREWARRDINVNAILPGAMLTDMTRHVFESGPGREDVASFRRGRLMEPGELDGALLLLAAKESRAITGSTIIVDDAQLP